MQYMTDVCAFNRVLKAQTSCLSMAPITLSYM